MLFLDEIVGLHNTPTEMRNPGIFYLVYTGVIELQPSGNFVKGYHIICVMI